jgi:hypothetical protein
VNESRRAGREVGIVSAKIEIDLKELQRHGEREIELMAAELASTEVPQGPEVPGRFVASGKTTAPQPSWQRRFLASGKTQAPRPRP